MGQHLYFYCILGDNELAPILFWGVCTLAICKPKISKVAKIGDWVAGTGSSKYGFNNLLVYAMRVTRKITFEEYYKYCQEVLPEKIPAKFSRDLKKKVGGCLYDYSTGKVIMRDWVAHRVNNMERDLSGRNVL